jgi:antitoxin MazE
MTALELNAELYRAMGEIADNETLLAKVLAYVKGLVTTQQKGANASARNGWAAAAKQAHADGEDKLMAADVFEDETMEDWKW